jgi:uncharacterized membrane protein
VTLGLFVLLGFMGLGLDLGYLRYTKRQLPKAADAAAIAGAAELTSCAGTADPHHGNANFVEGVADKIQLGVQWEGTNINTNFYNNFSTLANGSPIKRTGAVLVE